MKTFKQIRESAKKEDSDAVKAFLAKGGKIKKLAPGKAAGYHGKDDPGKDVAGMMDKPDTKEIGTRKKVKSMGEAADVKEISSKLAGRAYNAANKQTNYKKVTPTTAKKSDQGKKALAYHQRKSLDPSHTGTTYKGSGTDVAADYKTSSKPARKTAGKRIADLRKKGVDVDEAKQTHMFDNEKDARTKAKEIGGKYVKGTGKSAGKHAAIKESVATVAASAKGDHKAHMKAAKAHAIAAIKHMDQYKETNDPAHQKAAKLHRKAEQSHEGTAKLHKTSNNGQTKMTRTSIANKSTAAANAASEDV